MAVGWKHFELPTHAAKHFGFFGQLFVDIWINMVDGQRIISSIKSYYTFSHPQMFLFMFWIWRKVSTIWRPTANPGAIDLGNDFGHEEKGECSISHDCRHHCDFPVISYPTMTFQSVGDSNENFWLYAPHFCRNSSYWVAWSAAKTCWWSMASWWSWAFFPVHEMQHLVSAIMHESSTILAATPIYWGIRALCCSNWSESHLPPICEYNRHIPALPCSPSQNPSRNQGSDCTPTSSSNNQCS